MSRRLPSLPVKLSRPGKTLVVATHDLALIRTARQLAGGRVLLRAGGQLPAGAELAAVFAILQETLGLLEAQPFMAEEQTALLELWLEPDLPLDALPLPRLTAVVQGNGLDVRGTRLRFPAEVPGGTFDDHGRWHVPLKEAADRLRDPGWIVLALVAAKWAAVVTRAARA